MLLFNVKGSCEEAEIVGEQFIAQFGRKIIYCRGCGQLAGVETRCPVYRGGEHGFTTGEPPIVCGGCGAIPGSGSRCPVYRGGEHSFGTVE